VSIDIEEKKNVETSKCVDGFERGNEEKKKKVETFIK
jgi:hypothetical protein